MTPDWWEALLLAAASYRLWRLVARDEILLQPRLWLFRRVPDDVFTLINCAWCLGFWITLAWWGAWQAFPRPALVAATPFAISAAVGLIAHAADDD